MNNIKLVEAEKIENTECSEVTKEEIANLMELVPSMIEICQQKGGVGLAAPQIGVFKKMFIWMDKQNNFEVVFNPSYFKDGKETNVIEGCLNYPEQNFYVKRWKNISAVYFDQNFKRKTRKLSFERSFIFQHETDHLKGITINVKGIKI